MRRFLSLPFALLLIAAVNCSSFSPSDEEHDSLEDLSIEETEPVQVSIFSYPSLLLANFSNASQSFNHYTSNLFSRVLSRNSPSPVENNTLVPPTFSIPINIQNSDEHSNKEKLVENSTSDLPNSSISVITQNSDDEQPHYRMPTGFKVKSLVQMCRDADFKSTVVVDSLLVHAMRRSGAVKAYAIGSIMFTLFKQEMGMTYNLPNPNVLDELFLHYLFELPEQLRNLIKECANFSEMTFEDVDSLSVFIEKNYLRKPHEGRLFSLASKEGAPLSDIFTTISLAVFTIKLTSINITHRYDSWYTPRQELPDAVFGRIRIGLSLLTVKEVTPFIQDDIKTFILELRRLKFKDPTFMLFSNYLHEDVFKHSFTYFDMSSNQVGQLFKYIFLAMRNCPLAENKLESFLAIIVDDFVVLKNDLVAARAFMPVSLSNKENFSYNGVKVIPNPSQLTYTFGDYLLIVPCGFVTRSVVEEAFESGLLEFFAFSNGFTLLKSA